MEKLRKIVPPKPDDEIRSAAVHRGYSPPEIIYEGKLEIRVGSPLGRLPGTEFFDPASPLYRGDKK